MKNPDENQTPEEIQKTVEEVVETFLNESEAQKSKKKSEGKPGPKSDLEKEVETLINNL